MTSQGVRINEAAILVGGLGTRLRGVVADRPKGLVTVGGQSILSHILDTLAASTVKRVIMCTGYLGEQVENAFGSSYKSMELAYSREHAPLGTAGALVQAESLFRDERLMVMNGDSFSAFSVLALADCHDARKAVATILLAKVDDSSRYGAIEIDNEGAVVKWQEKGESVSTGAGPAWINAGVYLLNTELIRSLDSSVRSLEREVFPSLIGKGLFALENAAPFIDIGTPESLAQADAFFRSIGKR